VRFEGSVFTGGGYLEVFADNIIVDPYVTLSTRLAGVVDDGITFRARRIGTPEFENLLPFGFLNKSVSIDIGHDATLTGNSVT